MIELVIVLGILSVFVFLIYLLFPTTFAPLPVNEEEGRDV
jgi:hypothetical protein